MNINIIIAIDNEIVKSGLTSIIHNGILGSNVVNTEKDDFLNKILLNFFEIAIVQINKKNKADFELLNNLVACENKTKIFVLLENNMDARTIKFIKTNGIDFILNSDSALSIMEKIKFHIQYYRSRNSLKKRRKDKLKSLDFLLSSRELEIGTMLIKGVKLATIASKKNLSKSTVSTYKRRIYEKTKVNNIVDLAVIYNTYLIPNS